MAYSTTILHQVLKLIPRHEFETLAQAHSTGRPSRVLSRWGQFVALSFAQLAGRVSLRDVVIGLASQGHRLAHLDVEQVARSTLAEANQRRPASFFAVLFSHLYARCQALAPKHPLRFKAKLYSLDSTFIELCLSVFPWATFRQTKGAVKLHTMLDHDGYLPAFMTLTDGKCHDIRAARGMTFPKGSIVVEDRGYTDYSWFAELDASGSFFVTRLRKNARYTVLERRPVTPRTGVTSDHVIRLTGHKGKAYHKPLRRIGYRNPETGKHYVFLTNHLTLAASTICAIYKERWQIELFFKWVKQRLKIKAFLGTSPNAVLTQIWVALIVYLLLAYLKFKNKLAYSLTQILRVLQLNLFTRRDLLELLDLQNTGPPLSRLRLLLAA